MLVHVEYFTPFQSVQFGLFPAYWLQKVPVLCNTLLTTYQAMIFLLWSFNAIGNNHLKTNESWPELISNTRPSIT